MSDYSELVKRLSNARGTICPFDESQPDPGLEPTDPCPVCGDLGMFNAEDERPSMCIHGDAQQAAQAIERLAALVGGICAYPMCDCKGPGCQVLDAAVPEVCARSDLIEAKRELAEARAEIGRKDKLINRAGAFLLQGGKELARLTLSEALAAPAPAQQREASDADT